MKLNAGWFVKGKSQHRTNEHNLKIGQAQRRAWDEGVRKRVPVGSLRIHDGRQQVRAVTAGGYFVWRYTDRKEREIQRTDKYDRMGVAELMKLNAVVKNRLRRLGYVIPYGSAGAKKGYKQSTEHIEKRRLRLRKYLFDMKAVTSEAKERLRKSLEYRTWRSGVFQRDNWTCQRCEDRSGNGKTVVLEAHHRRSFTKYPSLRFNIENGVTLCRNCHRQESSRQMKRNTNGRRKALSGITLTSRLESI